MNSDISNQNQAHLYRAKRSKIKQQLLLITTLSYITRVIASQSIGYQPNFNYGFNPFFSPVHGYGLGLPYGAYGYSGAKHPWLAYHSLWGSPTMGSLASKIHTKSLMKKLGAHGGNYPYSSIFGAKYSGTLGPHSYNYGYGSHYGAARVPNNPYKSAYGDYYTSPSTHSTAVVTPDTNSYYDSSYVGSPMEYPMDKHAFIKPLLKAGALITTAALLGKKKLEMVPSRLNPSGMILSGVDAKLATR